jgi:hypothetical protein
VKIRHQFAVFGFFFFVYMFSASREIPWNDSTYLFNTAESIVFRGEIRIPSKFPGTFSYAPHPILPSLALVPGVMTYKWIVDRWMPAWSMAKVMTCHMGSAFFGALTCLLFLNACLRLGVSRRTASFSTLMLGLSTFIWVYARSPYSEIVQAAAVMGYAGALISFWDRQDYKTALRVGIWGALMLNSKLVFALALPGGLLFCLYRMRFELKRFFLLMLWALGPLAAGALVILKHNAARLGDLRPAGGAANSFSSTTTGYSVGAEMFAQPLWEGALGLLASPGRSVFLFAPPLVLSVVGLRVVGKRSAHLIWMLALCFLPVFYLYAKYEFWSGDWSWGPRYMVAIAAPLLVPAAVFLDAIFRGEIKVLRWWWRWAVPTVAIIGLVVTLLGNAFYWDHFIRITGEARNNWLGNPNRTGTKGVPPGTPCGPCFEDYYALQWMPPFQQIAGHWWLAMNVPFKRTWEEATVSAPWASYTTMVVPIPSSYKQARVDWWVLQFWKGYKPASLALILTFGLGATGCGLAWAWSCRKPRDNARSKSEFTT